jgi:hypothetical protein
MHPALDWAAGSLDYENRSHAALSRLRRLVCERRAYRKMWNDRQ